MKKFSLTDKYEVLNGKHILSGLQAIVKLSILEHELQKQNGKNVRGYVSGYRGSPLGSLDQEFLRDPAYFATKGVDFHPGLNEDLAATAIWGTQQIDILYEPTVDGVYGMWYGKGPGVDRCGDVFHHANFNGTHENGGVLLFSGDDHNCKSSTMPHQTEQQLNAWYIPTIAPSNVEDIMKLGLLGFELSRYSGLWCSVKIVADLADTFSTADVDLNKWAPVVPDKKFDVNIRWPDTGPDQEQRIHEQKLPAVQEFLKYNQLNEIIQQCTEYGSKLGIIAVGKSYQDTLTALDDLGITDEVSILKMGLTWPFQESLIEDFVLNHHKILVVEEKEPIVENQIKTLLYDEDNVPVIHGKDKLRKTMDLNPTLIGDVISEIWFGTTREEHITGTTIEKRTPHFCSGCPHNASTKIPEGSVATAGIGCHYMASWISPGTKTVTHMGGEGATWIGAERYSSGDHVFSNLGDGTYFHSGILSIRAAIAAKSNITFKILYNQAVAMTGGQPLDGELSLESLIGQLNAEGVGEIYLVTKEPKTVPWKGVYIHSTDDLDKIQKECREIPGVTAIIYDQWCATEKRKRIKRGEMNPDTTRAWINPEICEGCGDCSTQSNCLSIEAQPTELGVKRRIVQESCNQDLSCVQGYCPSFITVENAKMKTISKTHMEIVTERFMPDLIAPDHLDLTDTYNVIFAGIGGTGMVSAGQILGVAAHLQGHNVSVINQTGLAQKFGAVTSNISIGKNVHGKMALRTADLMIGCESQTAGSEDVIPFCTSDRTTSIVNNKGYISSSFIFDRYWRNDFQAVADVIQENSYMVDVDATRFTKVMIGNTVTNMSFLLGIAYQMGLLPVEEQYMLAAFELNGIKVDENKCAWYWGRYWSQEPEKALAILDAEEFRHRPRLRETFEDSFEYRIQKLRDSHGDRQADLYEGYVTQVYQRFKDTKMSDGVMRYLFRLMYIKDEYEVARLHSERTNKLMNHEFESMGDIRYNLVMPWNRKSRKKTSVGAWFKYVFNVMKYGKILRGSFLNPFNTEERKLEQQVLSKYLDIIDEITYSDTSYNELLNKVNSVHDIRGYGHIKEQAMREWLSSN